MRRTERLFQIIQILRRKRKPVAGRELAEELGVSLRSLYRDMAELIAQRIPVTGEAGVGYVLDDGYDMPPLMLTPDELEAAVLGAAWVARRGDPSLARGARDLITKIAQSVPAPLRPVLLDPSLRPMSLKRVSEELFDAAILRRALRDRLKVVIAYRNGDGTASRRTIWPAFIAYMEEVRIVAAWCELRGDFRHFRTDRIGSIEVTAERIPERRAALLRRWKASQNLPDVDDA
jgi:predicted DNA-binding transcriptional regulator YafY